MHDLDLDELEWNASLKKDYNDEAKVKKKEVGNDYGEELHYQLHLFELHQLFKYENDRVSSCYQFCE